MHSNIEGKMAMRRYRFIERMPFDDESRDWNEAFASPQIPRVEARKSQEIFILTEASQVPE